MANAVRAHRRDLNALRPALEAYQDSIYGAHLVKLSQAIEAYNAVPDAEPLSNALMAQANALALQNKKLILDMEKMRNALKAVSGRCSPEMQIIVDAALKITNTSDESGK